MSRSISLFTAMAAVLLVAVSSCITRVQQAPAPNSMVSNERVKVIGNYTATLGCGLFEADKAVRAAAKEKNLVQLSRTNEQDCVLYEYKDIYDNRISISLKLDVNKQVGIVIKFGKTGNKEFSKSFLEAVGFELNRATTAE